MDGLTETAGIIFPMCNIPVLIVIAILESIFLYRFLNSILRIRFLGTAFALLLIGSAVFFAFNDVRFAYPCFENKSLNEFYNRFVDIEHTWILVIRNTVLLLFSFATLVKLILDDEVNFRDQRSEILYTFAILYFVASSFFVTAFNYVFAEKAIAGTFWRSVYLTGYVIFTIMIISITLWKWKIQKSSSS